MDMFDRGLVLYERRGGRPAASVLRLRDGVPGDESRGGSSCSSSSSSGNAAGAALQELQLPGWAFSLTPGANADYHASCLRLTLSSPTQPDASVDVDLSTGALLLTRQSCRDAHRPPRPTHPSRRS